jgi:hypothetical protein
MSDVTLESREPYQIDGVFRWYDEEKYLLSKATVPQDAANRLTGEKRSNAGLGHKWSYPTREAALADLKRAWTPPESVEYLWSNGTKTSEPRIELLTVVSVTVTQGDRTATGKTLEVARRGLLTDEELIDAKAADSLGPPSALPIGLSVYGGNLVWGNTVKEVIQKLAALLREAE